ncbi:glutaredoxin [Kosmotoga arenicorallina S304]|uniref:Glutaredoxin n=1 Tax=Kosmotoga arenicorallina S304 TaxID=1453497 RepID=A0A176K156_9BACT|nr:thioredoxin family protein [Kosmotoga arenicorallina]OAA30136.1 glutaredoxin [Kosmotoga arenicorallina S304]
MAERLLNDEIRKQVKEILSEMKGKVKILFFNSDSNCDYCSTVEGLIGELTEITDQIEFERHELDSEKASELGIKMAPALVLLTPDGKDKGVRFYGIPSGHEFGTLLQDILSFSKNAVAELSPESLEKLSKIDKPVDIKVFVTPTCPYCPKAVLTAHNIAMANEHVTASMVEANEFPELSMEYGVSSVPHIVINDKVSFIGAYPEPQYVEEVLKAL